jgi:hypothetical protein
MKTAREILDWHVLLTKDVANIPEELRDPHWRVGGFLNRNLFLAGTRFTMCRFPGKGGTTVRIESPGGASVCEWVERFPRGALTCTVEYTPTPRQIADLGAATAAGRRAAAKVRFARDMCNAVSDPVFDDEWILAESGHRSLTIVKRLLSAGKISMADIERAIADDEALA